MMSPSDNMVEAQRRFFLVEIHVDGALISSATVSAYTEDMAVIHALLPVILIRLGLAPFPGTPGEEPPTPTPPAPPAAANLT